MDLEVFYALLNLDHFHVSPIESLTLFANGTLSLERGCHPNSVLLNLRQKNGVLAVVMAAHGEIVKHGFKFRSCCTVIPRHRSNKATAQVRAAVSHGAGYFSHRRVRFVSIRAASNVM